MVRLMDKLVDWEHENPGSPYPFTPDEAQELANLLVSGECEHRLLNNGQDKVAIIVSVSEDTDIEDWIRDYETRTLISFRTYPNGLVIAVYATETNMPTCQKVVWVAEDGSNGVETLSDLLLYSRNSTPEERKSLQNKLCEQGERFIICDL